MSAEKNHDNTSPTAAINGIVKMISNNVSGEVRRVVEGNPKAIEEASNNEDEMSSLSLTPGVSSNRTPPQPSLGATECPARKALFSNTAPSINAIDSNEDSCTINSTATKNDPSSDVPVFLQGGDKYLAETIFEKGYDSDGLIAEYFNEEHKIELCKKYNSIKVRGGALCKLSVMEAPAPQDTFY